MKGAQADLPACSDVFNLFVQDGIDPVRVMREQAESALRETERREYQDRMQLTLAQCPGYVGSDCPVAPGAVGKVSVDPRFIQQAVPWLKRRFHVDESFSLDLDTGMTVRVVARQRSKAGGRRLRVSFGKVEQFAFAFDLRT